MVLVFQKPPNLRPLLSLPEICKELLWMPAMAGSHHSDRVMWSKHKCVCVCVFCRQVKISTCLQWKEIHQRSPLGGLKLLPARCVASKLSRGFSSVHLALRPLQLPHLDLVRKVFLTLCTSRGSAPPSEDGANCRPGEDAVHSGCTHSQYTIGLPCNLLLRGNLFRRSANPY